VKHLLKILEISHLSKTGRIIWRANNLSNIFHNDGEEFMLGVLFVGTDPIPTNYYFGLDSRTSVAETDNLVSLINEPENGYFGYARQAVSSEGQFVLDTLNNHYYAKGPIITFTASDGTWVPLRNLFLATVKQNEYDGYLLASVPLSQTVTLDPGESINVQMGLSLKDC
jgi:hypothetical protein